MWHWCIVAKWAYLFLWPPCVADADIIFLPVVCSFFFFPRLISAVADWMSTILPHTMRPYCEFRMHVWNVLHVARWKCSTQKIAKNSPSGHHRTTLSGYIFAIFATKACLGSITVRHSSSWRQPNFAALNRGRRLYSAGRPLRWALAHISSGMRVTVTTEDSHFVLDVGSDATTEKWPPLDLENFRLAIMLPIYNFKFRSAL